MIPRRGLGIAIIAWSLVSWGGRIGLLTGAEAAQVWSWVRIAGSLVTALLAGVALIVSLRGARAFVSVYAGLAFVVWGASLLSVMPDPDTTLAFKAVHFVLALVSLTLAVLAVRLAFNSPELESELRQAQELPSSTVR